jgi:hypothetical protein
MHHKNPSRDGVYVQPTFTKAAIATLHKDPTFVPTGLQGNVYAQPLFVDGGSGGTDLVIVVTEQNWVYALNGANGAQVWAKNLGASVPLANLPCGNIDPYGVTGTPVIDAATQTLYLDAELIPPGGTPTHRVHALSLVDGTTKAGWPVDVAAGVKIGTTSFQPMVQGQRGALALVGGTLYVPYGGRYGDCGAYHGWVVAIPTANPVMVTAWATTAQAGGIWSPNGISTDGKNLFVSTGNTQGANNTWGGGDAIIRLTPAPLGMSAYFAPKNWQNLDNQDLDLGTGPIPFDLPGGAPSTLAIAFGKDGNAYLVDRSNPGGVGAALGANAAACTPNNANACASLHVSQTEVISAPAVYATLTATYAVAKGAGSACTVGAGGDMFAVKIVPGSPPTVAASWCASTGSGSPMVTTTDGHANAIVWNLGVGLDNHLHAFDGDTGAPITFTGNATALPGMRTYNTPIAAKGRIFVPVDGNHGGVVAFTL